MNNVNNLRKIIEILRKDVSYDNIKINKKPGFHPSLEDTNCKRPQGVVKLTPQSF